MLVKIKKLVKFIKIFITATILIIINSSPIEVYGKAFNQFKETELNSILNKEFKDLIILTVTGDTRYRNTQLQKLYKDLQIFHVLIISASNILLLLNFIHIFIYRKNKTDYFMTIFFIYFYGRYISFPETFLRSIQTISINQLSSAYGIKVSKERQLIILMTAYFVTFYSFKLGDSYKLSAIYSSVIALSVILSNRLRHSRIEEFVLLSINLTITSTIIFDLTSFTSICTTFIANIFVNIFYDFAIYLSYIVYLLPEIFFTQVVRGGINHLFEFIILSLNLLHQLTYNICYDKLDRYF